MIRAILALSAGAGGASVVAIEAVIAIQGARELGPDVMVPGSVVVQVGILLSSASCFVLAGMMVKGWSQTQKTMVEEVKKIEPLIERVAKLEGIVEQMGQRNRRFDIPDSEKESA